MDVVDLARRAAADDNLASLGERREMAPSVSAEVVDAGGFATTAGSATSA